MAATGTPTPNIGLRIPLGTDPASVDDINYNSNLIDTKLGAVGNDSVQDQIDDLNSKFKTDTASGTTDSNGNIKVSTSVRHIFFAMYAGYCLIPFVYAGETYLKAVGTGGSTLTVAANLNINITYYYIDG